MTHECDYQLDLDGQVTCAICGAMDDDMKPETPPRSTINPEHFETQMDFE
jgi:hypothetical protein